VSIRAGSAGGPTLGSLLRSAATTRAIGPLVIAVAIQSLGNLGFHAVVGRLLPADSYGALGAALAAMTMLGVPLGALQTAASGLVAEHGLTSRTTVRVLRSVAIWAGIPAAIALAGSPAIQSYLHLSTWLDAALLAPYLLVAALGATARGLLLGQRQVGAVADTYLVGTAVRLGLGLSLVGPLGVSGALAGTLAGELATLLATLERLTRHTRAIEADGVVENPGALLRIRAVGRAALAVTGLFLFSTVDLLLARHHLRGADSGGYVAAATVAKTVLALPAAVISAVFPRLVSAWPLPGRARALGYGGLVVICPALIASTIMITAPNVVLRLLYGSTYSGAAQLVQVLSAVAALTSLVSLFTYAAVARRSKVLLLPWAGAALEVGLIEAHHDNAAQIAFASATALMPTLLVMVAVEGRAWLKGHVMPHVRRLLKTGGHHPRPEFGQRAQLVAVPADRLPEPAEHPLPQGG
jgi:O-antigen/teichoic acid export membrane protein